MDSNKLLVWFDRLKNTLVDWGFSHSKCDTSLFFFKSHNKVLFILVYVDDILITNNDKKLVQDFIHRLNKIFALKDMGSLHHFLGIEVHRDETVSYAIQIY